MMIEDEELRNLYKISSEEHLLQLEVGLRYLQVHPDDQATLDDLRREAHSLKGDSRSVGVENVEILIHQVEDILLRLKRQQIFFTPQLFERIYEGLKAIGWLVQEVVTGQPSGVDTDRMLKDLQEVVSQPQERQKLDLQETEAEQNVELESQVSTTLNPRAEINNNTLQISPSFIEDEELRNLYKFSSEEHLRQLEAGLQYLQAHPDDEDILEDLCREAHSLKGDSRSVGCENVETLSHQVEEILLRIKGQQTVLTPQLLERLHEGLEVISLLVQEAVTGQLSRVNTESILSDLTEAISPLQKPQEEANQELSNLPVVAATFIEDEELRNIYKITTQERLQKLEAGLLHLEKYPDDEATLGQLLREAHSLKGDSTSVGVENVETLIHQVEEIFLNIKRQPSVLKPQLFDVLYQGMDAISLLVKEAVTGQPSGVDLVRMINQLMGAAWETNIQESLEITPEISSLPAKTQAQELASFSESYSIDTIRVSTRDLDALMTQADELTVTKISIGYATSSLEKMVTLWQEWKAFHRQKPYIDSSYVGSNPYEERLEKMMESLRNSTQENSTKLDTIAGELREKIGNLRLLPLATIFQLFPRMVRDLAKQQSKEVELIIEGGETTADKRILEEIKDSLMHMIRNAIDHGIETPDEREKLGKPPVATIWLRGYQKANNIIIEVADDGRGLDIEKIQQTAIKRKLYQPEELANMTPSQIHSLIFAPGFSTRTFITEISGRGIGLDVVRTNVERFKGNIQIESTPGKGCSFRLHLGTTLATLNVLLLEVQGIVHALPIEFVETSLLILQDEIFNIEGSETIILDGQNIAVANLSDLLELSNSSTYLSQSKIEQQKSSLRPCLLLKVGDEQFGLFVDRFLDTQEVVIKPQSHLLKRVRNIMGATILASGEVCMILNPPDLLKSLQKPTTFSVSIKSTETIKKKPVILLVEDSVPVRTQEKRLLEGAGYEVVIAVDGLDGYNKLKTRNFDAVISDVEMPNLDGFSLTAKIRQHQKYEELPIILVTTLAGDEDKKRGAEAGANAYIIKSKFNQTFLLETLGKLV